MQLSTEQSNHLKAENAARAALNEKLCANPKKPYFLHSADQIIDLHLLNPEQILAIFGESE